MTRRRKDAGAAGTGHRGQAAGGDSTKHHDHQHKEDDDDGQQGQQQQQQQEPPGFAVVWMRNSALMNVSHAALVYLYLPSLVGAFSSYDGLVNALLGVFYAATLAGQALPEVERQAAIIMLSMCNGALWYCVLSAPWPTWMGLLWRLGDIVVFYLFLVARADFHGAALSDAYKYVEWASSQSAKEQQQQPAGTSWWSFLERHQTMLAWAYQLTSPILVAVVWRIARDVAQQSMHASAFVENKALAASWAPSIGLWLLIVTVVPSACFLFAYVVANVHLLSPVLWTKYYREGYAIAQVGSRSQGARVSIIHYVNGVSPAHPN